MKAREIRDLITSEVEEQIKSSKEEFFNLRLQLVTGQLEETTRVHIARKTITRLKTVARERETEQSKAS